MIIISYPKRSSFRKYFSHLKGLTKLEGKRSTNDAAGMERYREGYLYLLRTENFVFQHLKTGIFKYKRITDIHRYHSV